MENKEIIYQVKLLLIQQSQERNYTKQKPYSHTLTEKLHQELTQTKLEI